MNKIITINLIIIVSFVTFFTNSLLLSCKIEEDQDSNNNVAKYIDKCINDSEYPYQYIYTHADSIADRLLKQEWYPSSKKQLLSLLDDKNELVRIYALMILSRINLNQSVPIDKIEELFTNGDVEQRVAVIHSLPRIHKFYDVNKLYNKISHSTKNEKLEDIALLRSLKDYNRVVDCSSVLYSGLFSNDIEIKSESIKVMPDLLDPNTSINVLLANLEHCKNEKYKIYCSTSIYIEYEIFIDIVDSLAKYSHLPDHNLDKLSKIVNNINSENNYLGKHHVIYIKGLEVKHGRNVEENTKFIYSLAKNEKVEYRRAAIWCANYTKNDLTKMNYVLNFLDDNCDDIQVQAARMLNNNYYYNKPEVVIKLLDICKNNKQLLTEEALSVLINYDITHEQYDEIFRNVVKAQYYHFSDFPLNKRLLKLSLHVDGRNKTLKNIEFMHENNTIDKDTLDSMKAMIINDL